MDCVQSPRGKCLTVRGQLPPAKRRQRARHAVANDPLRAFQMRTPAMLRSRVRRIETHQIRSRDSPIDGGIMRIDQARIEREITLIVIDHGLACRCQCVHHSHLVVRPPQMTPIRTHSNE